MLSGKGSFRRACIEGHTHSHVGKRATNWARILWLCKKHHGPVASNNRNLLLLSMGQKSSVQASTGTACPQGSGEAVLGLLYLLLSVTVLVLYGCGHTAPVPLTVVTQPVQRLPTYLQLR